MSDYCQLIVKDEAAKSREMQSQDTKYKQKKYESTILVPKSSEDSEFFKK